MLTNAKNKNTVLIITLNPSLDFILVEIIDAIDPNKREPVTDAKIMIGKVSIENMMRFHRHIFKKYYMASIGPIIIIRAELLPWRRRPLPFFPLSDEGYFTMAR